MNKVVIIGAGLGGLSCAIRLAAAGYRVTVIERQNAVGGMLQLVSRQGYTFDRGPNMVVMPHMVEHVFRGAGRRMEDYVQFYPLQPYVRNVFHDGMQVDVTGRMHEVAEQIALYSPQDAAGYVPFMQEASRMYWIFREQFQDRLTLGTKELLNPKMLRQLLQIRPFTSFYGLLKRYFRHPHTLTMLGRHAVYTGSTPYQSPSISAMIAHVESRIGVVGVRGGVYKIAEAFGVLARELGVEIRTSAEATRIRVRGRKVVGVETTVGDFPAEWIVANTDSASLYRDMIQEQDRSNRIPASSLIPPKPSSSGFVLMVGCRRRYEGLKHHTVFFSADCNQEYRDIFKRGVVPQAPTLYVNWRGHDEEGTAPEGGSALHVLVHVPPLSDTWRWDEQSERYKALVLARLEAVGLQGLSRDAEVLLTYTPEQLRQDTGVYGGGMFGMSGQTFRRALLRQTNQSELFDGLWFVGGATRPGGGVPLVTLSGQLVAEALMQSARDG